MDQAIDREIRIFGQDKMWIQFVIYDRPSDYPDAIIVRPWLVGGESKPGAPGEPAPLMYHWEFSSIDAARLAIRRFRPGAMCFRRSPKDEIHVVETWW